ncbi:MAG: 4-hydroxy-tetrahydrodipicolinate reductase [Planctomycetes bacterium]|nr:4-hydroxy-tetrahydrodipicolinate reductase [Planctomycetota bacterium]
MSNKVAIVGAAGRMGRRLIDLVNSDAHLQLGAAVEVSSCPLIGQDAGEVASVGRLDIPLSDSFEGHFDAIIDFSSPDALAGTVDEAVSRHIPLVIGVTGLQAEHNAKLEEAASEIPLIWAPNFSVGVNLLFRIAEQVAWALGDDYDAEVIEIHHRFKADAPSGTALGLAKAVAAAREVNLEKVAKYGRHGRTGERNREEIGIHAVRAGDIVGDHTVIFSCLGERVELIHRAHTRDAFAQGALRAAKFLMEDKPPGKYTMAQVLGF